MTDIQSMTDCAALLYRRGVKLPNAVASALDQYNVRDRMERETLYREICSRLGRRGGKKKKAAREKPTQKSFSFGPPGKR